MHHNTPRFKFKESRELFFSGTVSPAAITQCSRAAQTIRRCYLDSSVAVVIDLINCEIAGVEVPAGKVSFLKT